MSSLHFPGQDRFGVSRRSANSLSVAALLTLTLVSAATGAVVALVIHRFAQRQHMIEVLPSPAPVRHIRGQAPARSPDRTAPSGSSTAANAGSSLGSVAANLTAARTVELERLVADYDDVMAGDGTMDCPASFPIKGNGRSGIYHWPGSSNYQQARPTLCFCSIEAAERAGFRPANR